MFGNTALARVPTFKLILGFGLCTLGGAMLYTYFKNRDEEEEDSRDANKKNGYAKGAQNGKNVKQTEKPVSITIDVPEEQIPLLLGRSGSNLKSIEDRTNTKIEFSDKNAKTKICKITGFPNNVKEARGLIMNQIERVPIVKEEIYVPQSVCGQIMGRCGEAMQEICRASLAKITIDSGGRSSGGGGMDRRKIIITGTSPQVSTARKLIEAKIEEDEELRRIVEEAEQRREPRRSPTNSVSSSMYSSQTSLSSHIPPREKLLASKADEKPMEIYVSAIASPSKFWVQLIGPQTKKLDDMVKTMTGYYNEASNRELHKITEPYLGQIVAAVFKYDGKWYRAEIVGILPNEYKPDELVLDLYFVDYGDSEYVYPHEVFELRTDFLTLRFQAVECFLANVKTTLNNTDTWDPQAIQKFEELTQVANWKKLISRVVTYKERPKAANGVLNSAAREGSPIPGVELFDLTEGVEVNLGHMLISHGFALPLEDRPRSPHYRTATPESLNLNQAQQQQQQKPEQPQFLPLTPPNSATSIEDALLDQQLQHLQKNKNLYLNGHNSDSNAAKFNAEMLNGNYQTTPSTVTAAAATKTLATDTHNGNLSR